MNLTLTRRLPCAIVEDHSRMWTTLCPGAYNPYLAHDVFWLVSKRIDLLKPWGFVGDHHKKLARTLSYWLDHESQ